MSDTSLIRRELREGDLAMDWDGDMEPAIDGAVEHVARGIHAQVWPGQRADVAYVPVLVSERPGSGQLDAFLVDLAVAVAPRELVFVNVVNAGLAGHLEALGFRVLAPEDAFDDGGSEARSARSLQVSL